MWSALLGGAAAAGGCAPCQRCRLGGGARLMPCALCACHWFLLGHGCFHEVRHSRRKAARCCSVAYQRADWALARKLVYRRLLKLKEATAKGGFGPGAQWCFLSIECKLVPMAVPLLLLSFVPCSTMPPDCVAGLLPAPVVRALSCMHSCAATNPEAYSPVRCHAGWPRRPSILLCCTSSAACAASC